MPRLRELLLLVGLFLLGAGNAWAADQPEIIPFHGRGFASDAEVRRLTGGLSFRMESCDRNPDVWNYRDSRYVVATLRKRPTDFETRGDLVDAVLRQAARFGWRDCPHPVYFIGRLTDDFFYNIDDVVIQGPDGQTLISARLGSRGLDMHGDNGSLGSTTRGYTWDRVRNVYAETQQAEADARARMARAEAARAERARREEESRRASASFWGWVRLVAFAGFALWLWSKRETILYWYYSLTPHPAGTMVDQAISTGEPLDGAAFATSVRLALGDNDVEKAVRANQARALAERWREREAALQVQEARLVKDAQRQSAKENALLQAQADLLNAAIAHEQAMARVDALREKEERE